MIFLAQKYRLQERATIAEIASAYSISRNHLMKIVHELGQAGFIKTTQGRSGGIELLIAPETITIGQVVRFAEGDFSIVECHEPGNEMLCAIAPTCNLKKLFRRAAKAFLQELDSVTLASAIASPRQTSQLLGLEALSAKAALSRQQPTWRIKTQDTP